MTTLPMGRFKPADHYNNEWAAALSAEHTIEDVLRPEFWSHIAGSLKPGDLIRLIPEQADYYARLIVIAAQRGFAKVKIIDFVDLTQAMAIVSPDGADISDDIAALAPLPVELAVEWKGPAVKFAVIRNSDGQRLKAGFTLKTEAEQWARDHLAAMAR